MVVEVVADQTEVVTGEAPSRLVPETGVRDTLQDHHRLVVIIITGGVRIVGFVSPH